MPHHHIVNRVSALQTSWFNLSQKLKAVLQFGFQHLGTATIQAACADHIFGSICIKGIGPRVWDTDNLGNLHQDPHQWWRQKNKSMVPKIGPSFCHFFATEFSPSPRMIWNRLGRPPSSDWNFNRCVVNASTFWPILTLVARNVSVSCLAKAHWLPWREAHVFGIAGIACNTRHAY